jgi:hypothetical protein
MKLIMFEAIFTIFYVMEFCYSEIYNWSKYFNTAYKC